MARGLRTLFASVLVSSILIAAGPLALWIGAVGATQSTTGGVTIPDPRADPNGALRDVRAFALTTNPAAGPLRSEFHLGSADLEFLAGGVHLSDFYARATYFTPDDHPAGVWSIGVAFWAQNENSYYDMLIQVGHGAVTWSFARQSGANLQVLHQGDLGSGAVDLTPGALNSMSLVVAQGLAILSGNDMAVAATVDLGDAAGSGDVIAQAAFLADRPDTSDTVRFLISDYSVWDLSPALSASPLGADETSTISPPTPVAEQPAAGATGSNLKLQETFDRLRWRLDQLRYCRRVRCNNKRPESASYRPVSRSRMCMSPQRSSIRPIC